MPRNASGVYSLPQSPFVPQTTIQSSAVNSDLSDIATALTQSIASNGVTPITSPITFVGGTVTSPGITFVGDTDTGIYQVSPGVLGIGCNGIQACQFDQTNGIDVTLGANFTGTVYTFSSGAAAAYLAALAEQFTITITIDGGGSVPSTGSGKAYYLVPCNCTVTQWTLTADQSGSAVVDVTMSSFGAFPPSSSIAGSALPTLSSAQSNQTSTLTGWTTVLPKGNILGFNLSSVMTCTRLQVTLLCTRTGR